MIYIVNTYDEQGRPFEDDSAVFDTAELGADNALIQANAAYDFYVAHGAVAKLLQVA